MLHADLHLRTYGRHVPLFAAMFLENQICRMSHVDFMICDEWPVAGQQRAEMPKLSNKF